MFVCYFAIILLVLFKHINCSHLAWLVDVHLCVFVAAAALRAMITMLMSSTDTSLFARASIGL